MGVLNRVLVLLLLAGLLLTACSSNDNKGDEAARARIEPNRPVEAETGGIEAPMRVLADDAASGGSYVTQDDPGGIGAVSFTLDLGQEGTYRLNGLVQAGGRTESSFTVQYDDLPPMLWQLPQSTTGWTSAPGPEVWLAAGQHTLRIEYREAESKLDRLQIDLLPAVLSNSADSASTATDWYVSPDGRTSNDGRSSETPLGSLQTALERAQPGDTVRLAAGEYREDVRTVRGGLPGEPITITGPGGAVLHGAGDSRIFEINHAYITLQGFTIDGLHGDDSDQEGHRDKLIYVQGTVANTRLLGIRIIDMSLKNAGGECVRLRYFVQQAEVADNNIGPCGVYDFEFDDGGKNGEGIYVGTSSTQWADGNNPTAGPDLTTNVWIHHNTIETDGNECVDIKEGSFGNIVEHNTCSGQRDPNSAGFGSRGDDNLFRFNKSSDNLGAGFRLGGHRLCLDPDGIIIFNFEDGEAPCAAPNRILEYGKDNLVYDNQMTDNADGGIAIEVSPQTRICGNEVSGTGEDTAGEFKKDFDPSADC